MDIIKDDTDFLELIRNLQKEIINRKWAEKKANDALDYAESIIDSIINPIIVLDEEDKIISVNIPFIELFSLGTYECLGKPLFDFHNGLFNIAELKKLIQNNKTQIASIYISQEFKLLGQKHLEVKAVNLQYNVKHLNFKLIMFHDITEMKNIQTKLENIILEKQLLLREINHRVKNNLCIIESLLNLELPSIVDEVANKAMMKTIARIHSVTTLYENLSSLRGNTGTNFKQFLELFIEDIKKVFGDKATLTLEMNFDDFCVDGNLMFQIGLLLNELFTNSIKYAFEETENPQIKLSARNKDGRILLTVSDNGCGMSETSEKKNGFGHQLIKMMVDQLSGDINYERKNGLVCTISLPQNP